MMSIFPTAGLHYIPKSFMVIFERNDELQSVEVPILSDNMTEEPKNFTVALSFIDYTNGQAITDKDVKRILLGDDAQVTIYSGPTSEPKTEAMQTGIFSHTYFSNALVSDPVNTK